MKTYLILGIFIFLNMSAKCFGDDTYKLPELDFSPRGPQKVQVKDEKFENNFNYESNVSDEIFRSYASEEDENGVKRNPSSDDFSAKEEANYRLGFKKNSLEYWQFDRKEFEIPVFQKLAK